MRSNVIPLRARGPRYLLLGGPGEAVGICSGVDFSDDFECLQIDDRDKVVGSECNVGALSVGLDLNAATTAAANLEALDFFFAEYIVDHELAAGGDESFGAVG